MVITFKDSIPGPQDGRLGYLSQKLGRTIFAAEKIDFDLPGATNTSEGIRPGSRNADSQLGLPQASPLVYPEVDLPMTKQLKEEGMNKKGGASQRLKVAGNWVQGYMEKRALQQQCLVVRRGFSQRGPGHPEDNGKLLAALTSGGRPGHKNLIQRTAGFIKDAQALKRSLDSSRDSTRSQPQDQKTTEPSGNGPQQGMQHLCVVNLPTEEELRQSVALLDLLLQQTGQCSPHY
ncbi:hypothetical protein N7492_008607 [Penicillium capsulatum]|uniref:Uncharacterized protein n=1 Tax=Penicillium capsulatum TaxID=69766 RepID=A0A9W9LGY1_9EURO|nr:hypothetical protein N7492_008607 [Penicillium capsulatum]